MKKILLKSSFIFLLSFTVLIIILAISYFININLPGLHADMVVGYAIIILSFLIIYFSLITYINYINYKVKEDIITLILVFIFGVFPKVYIIK